MTVYYSAKEEQYLAEKRAKPGFEGSIELFMCSDGNYRDAEAKAKFDEMRSKLLGEYGLSRFP